RRLSDVHANTPAVPHAAPIVPTSPPQPPHAFAMQAPVFGAVTANPERSDAGDDTGGFATSTDSSTSGSTVEPAQASNVNDSEASIPREPRRWSGFMIVFLVSRRSIAPGKYRSTRRRFELREKRRRVESARKKRPH